MIILNILLIIFLLSITVEKSLPIRLKWNEFFMPGITILLGTPPQPFEFLVTTFSSKLYIPKDDGFSCEASSTCVNHKTTIDLKFISDKAKGTFVTDTIDINGIKVSNFDFIQISQGEFTSLYKGMVGFDYLALEHDRDINKPLKYSLLSTLYLRGLISEQKFSIGIINGTDILLLGGYGIDKSKLNYKNYRTCDLIQKNSNGVFTNLWKCIINAIYFDDGSIYKIEDELAFGISYNFLTVDQTFFDFMVEKFFTNAMHKNICRVMDNFAIKSIWCDNSFNTKSLGVFSFVFGKWNLKFDTAKLWSDIIYRGQREFNIVFHSEKKYTWSINYNFLRDEYIMVFDREFDKFGLIKNNKLSK